MPVPSVESAPGLPPESLRADPLLAQEASHFTGLARILSSCCTSMRPHNIDFSFRFR